MISGVRESFLDEGVDEQVLQELRMIWEGKLIGSKAIDNGTGNMEAGSSTNGATINIQLKQLIDAVFW